MTGNVPGRSGGTANAEKANSGRNGTGLVLVMAV
jgi:hypothetical protein